VKNKEAELKRLLMVKEKRFQHAQLLTLEQVGLYLVEERFVLEYQALILHLHLLLHQLMYLLSHLEICPTQETAMLCYLLVLLALASYLRSWTQRPDQI